MAPGGGVDAATGSSCTVGPGRVGGGNSSLRGHWLWPALRVASRNGRDQPAAGGGADMAADLAVVDPASGRLPLERPF